LTLSESLINGVPSTNTDLRWSSARSSRRNCKWATTLPVSPGRTKITVTARTVDQKLR